MGKSGEGKSKQVRWSKPMERVLLEILADEVKVGNRPNQTFRTSSFNRVSTVILEKFGVECSSYHVEHHLRTVKSAWTIIDQLRGKSGFGWDDTMKMVTASPEVYLEYVQAHPTHEKYLNKKIEMYDEMALVVGKDRARGNFAKSFSDINLESRSEYDTIQLNDDTDNEEISRDREVEKISASSSATSSQPRQHRKRNREEPNLQVVSEKLGEVADAISRLSGYRLDVQSLHDEIMKIEEYDDVFLASAFDYLVEHEMLGKAFMAKNNNLRRIWLENFRKK